MNQNKPLNNITMPVNRLSYSSLTQLLRNPLVFKMKYILNMYYSPIGVAGMVGRAGHEALKVYYGGNPDFSRSTDPVEARAEAIEFGLQYLDKEPDQYINYGKTGTREDMLKKYTQVMNHYFSEEPKYHEILMCEEKMEAEIKTKDGDLLPLPAVGVPDLVHKTADGEIEIIDNKFTSSFTPHDKEDGIKIIQAMFLYHLLLETKGIKADRAIFREIKTSKNSDDMPQIRDWVVPFDNDSYFVIFYNLYKDVCHYLQHDPVFLPNLSDMFDGEDAWNVYAQELVGVDMSDVEVMHKIKDVQFTPKKFVKSRLDRAENKHLPTEERIRMKLVEFGIPSEFVGKQEGLSATLYQYQISAGVRMSTIKKHKDDITAVVQTSGQVRFLTPVPGTEYFGIEVPNEKRGEVKLTKKYLQPGKLSIPVGVDVYGETVTVAFRDMPHLLVAGSSGSGKSVFLRSLITAITKQLAPSELELVLIDPKRVELKEYSKLKHLDGGIIYEFNDCIRRLVGLTDEMERRYKLLENSTHRDIDSYNARKAKNKLPYIVVVIDEYADLIMHGKAMQAKKQSYTAMGKRKLHKIAFNRGLVSINSTGSKDDYIDLLEADDNKDEINRGDADIELLITRLAQMARAVGIHLVISTQRPSVDVITGLIKANFPTRIALTTSSSTDSKVILGDSGAEKLSGKGDMLFMHPGKPITRLQGFNI